MAGMLPQSAFLKFMLPVNNIPAITHVLHDIRPTTITLSPCGGAPAFRLPPQDIGLKILMPSEQMTIEKYLTSGKMLTFWYCVINMITFEEKDNACSNTSIVIQSSD
jgi:hypothetical protein